MHRLTTVLKQLPSHRRYRPTIPPVQDHCVTRAPRLHQRLKAMDLTCAAFVERKTPIAFWMAINCDRFGRKLWLRDPTINHAVAATTCRRVAVAKLIAERPDLAGCEPLRAFMDNKVATIQDRLIRSYTR